MSTPSLHLTSCPECAVPAEVVDRHHVGSTSGPVELATVVCAAGHRFMMPTEGLLPGVEPVRT